MPGVKVTTTTSGGSAVPLRSASGQLFVVGLAERGPTSEVATIRGMADYEAVFGRRTSYGYLYDTLQSFFDEGGEQARVVRVVGPAADVGTVTINDTAGTPLPTLRADAASPGAWSSDLRVVVSLGSLANTVKVTITLNGVVVEEYNNLSSPSAIVNRFAGSNFVRFTDMGSSTAAPANLPSSGSYVVTAGDDDREDVTAVRYTDALALFVPGMGDGAVAVPGVGPAVHGGLVAHAQNNRRIALLSDTVDADQSTLIATAAAVNSDAAGLFAPWVQVADGGGGLRSIPPEGYVAGVRARAHQQVGPWRVPAGGIAASRSLVGLTEAYTSSESESLNAARVNPILQVGNSVRLYGWRSLSADEENYGYLSARDLLNRLVVESERRLENYVFAPIDTKGQLLSSINAEIVGIVEPIRQAGGLYELVGEDGVAIDKGYNVETGNSVNSAQSLAQNEVKARLSVRVAPTGAMISLTIVKVGLLTGM